MSKPCNGMSPSAARPLKNWLTDGKRAWRKPYGKLKAQVRVYVEQPFHGVKNIFKYKKTRYVAGIVEVDLIRVSLDGPAVTRAQEVKQFGQRGIAGSLFLHTQ